MIISYGKIAFDFPDEMTAKAEAVAIEAGFNSLGEFLSQLLIAETVGAPNHLTIRTDEELEALLLSRIDRPWVEVNPADFQQMREKLKLRLGKSERRS